MKNKIPVFKIHGDSGYSKWTLFLTFTTVISEDNNTILYISQTATGRKKMLFCECISVCVIELVDPFQIESIP